MELSKYIHNNCITVKVVPHSSQTKLIEENNKLKIYLTSIPDKEKANKELIKYNAGLK
ncbi:TPA: DUF167 domain-containing protein [Candidatus Woesearchaeota archaeon]|nr:DUF167 domain-containing protein [Candidatus Woesearchaeota archaeon]